MAKENELDDYRYAEDLDSEGLDESEHSSSCNYETRVTSNGIKTKDEHKEDEALLALAFEEQVRPFIDLIDDLRCHGLDKDISLPSVVVIGDQSSGKSSILEAISGIQLPRGSGIVTRCPLEMQLKRAVRSGDSWSARLSYQTTLGAGQKIIDVRDPELLSGLIETAQNEIAGDNKGISSSLITLRVESPSSPDLTLIDLPGIARTPVGDQPLNICDQIKSLLSNYIKKKNTIILCVIPCNVDIATNEALSMAKAVDADGVRTLGVLTKPDLIDEGSESEIIAILNNQKFVLKKGYLIVRCRGQRDLTSKLNLASALLQEQDFFEKHSVFHDIPEEMRGTKQLAHRLTTILVEHIQNTLPDIREEVRNKLEHARDMMELLGEGPPNEESEKRLYLLKLVNEATRRIRALLVDGESIPDSAINIRKRGLMAGVSYNSSVLWRHWAQKLKENVDKMTKDAFERGDLCQLRIESKMANARGPELPGFISYQLFEKIVREHVSSYKHHSKDFLEKICADVEDLVAHVLNECFSRLPQVKSKCRGLAEEVRENCKGEALKLLDLEMKRENLVFSQDQTFEEEISAIEKDKEEKAAAAAERARSLPKSQGNEKTPARNNPEIMRDLLMTYLNIANRRFLDNVPLLFRMKLHCDFNDLLQQKLHRLCSSSDVVQIVQEERQAMIERKHLKARIERLTYATIELSCKF